MNPDPFALVTDNIPYFILVVARILALFFTTPLLSTQSVPRIVKIALAGLVAFLVFPLADTNGWITSVYTLDFILLLIGEVLLGVITGFFVSMLFATFSSAGQFFSYQMGLGASEVYDALAQIENPVLGQFFNLVAMLVFLQIKGFQNLFLGGIVRSFQSINCFSLLYSQEVFISFFLKGLTDLFLNAMAIAIPIVGTLFLIHVSMGLVSKAAPQMNLMSEGFPITILVSFVLLIISLPVMINVFVSIMESGFVSLETLLIKAGHPIP